MRGREASGPPLCWQLWARKKSLAGGGLSCSVPSKAGGVSFLAQFEKSVGCRPKSGQMSQPRVWAFSLPPSATPHPTHAFLPQLKHRLLHETSAAPQADAVSLCSLWDKVAQCWEEALHTGPQGKQATRAQGAEARWHQEGPVPVPIVPA